MPRIGNPFSKLNKYDTSTNSGQVAQAISTLGDALFPDPMRQLQGQNLQLSLMSGQRAYGALAQASEALKRGDVSGAIAAGVLAGVNPSHLASGHLAGVANAQGATAAATQNAQVGAGMSYGTTAQAVNNAEAAATARQAANIAENRRQFDQTQVQVLDPSTGMPIFVPREKAYGMAPIVSETDQRGAFLRQQWDRLPTMHPSQQQALGGYVDYRTTPAGSREAEAAATARQAANTAENRRQFDQTQVQALDPTTGMPVFVPRSQSYGMAPIVSETDQRGAFLRQNWAQIPNMAPAQQQALGAYIDHRATPEGVQLGEAAADRRAAAAQSAEMERARLAEQFKQRQFDQTQVQVLDPATGQPVLVPRSQAYGMAPVVNEGEQRGAFLRQKWGELPTMAPSQQQALGGYIDHRATQEGAQAAEAAATGRTRIAEQAKQRQFEQTQIPVLDPTTGLPTLVPRSQSYGMAPVVNEGEQRGAFLRQNWGQLPNMPSEQQKVLGGHVADTPVKNFAIQTSKGSRIAPSRDGQTNAVTGGPLLTDEERADPGLQVGSVTIQGSDMTGVKGMTSAEAAKARASAEAGESALRGARASVANIKALLAQPDAAGAMGLVGKFAGGLNEMRSQVEAGLKLAGASGFEQERDAATAQLTSAPSYRRVASQMQSLGVHKSVMDSAVIELAYMLQKVREPTGAISNQAIEQSLQTIGAASGDPKVMGATLDSLMERLEESHGIRIGTLREAYPQANIPAQFGQRQNAAPTQQAPPQQAPAGRGGYRVLGVE